GVHLSGAATELASLQELVHLPVGTTTMGKGSVDETHPLSLGVIGYAMGRRSRARPIAPLVDSADLVVLVGNRTNQNGTDSWRLFPAGAKFIHIDIDGTEVGRNYEALRLVGDGLSTIRALGNALGARDLSLRLSRRKALEQTIADARADADR